MKHTETAVFGQRRPSKLVAIISSAVLLIAIIASILLGIIMPKSSIVEAPSGHFNSVAAVGNDLYVATSNNELTETSISRIDASGNVKMTLDLAAFGAEKGLTLGETTHVQTQTGTPNIWAFTSGKYLFKLLEVDGEITIADYVKLDDGLLALTEENGYVYILERVARFSCLKKFDLSKPLSDGPDSVGHLYTPTQKGDEVTLKPANNLTVLSFEIMERNNVEYAYIMHSDGLLVVSTDASQNSWKVLYDEKYPAAYETEYNKAVNKLINEEGKTETDAKAAVEENIYLVEGAANAVVVEELKSSGLIAYNHGTGEVTISASEFDKSLYNNYPAKGVEYRGVAYVESEDKYYVVTNDFNMIVCDAAQELDLKKKAGAANFKHEDANIVLPKRPEVEGNALYYDKDLKIGYVVYTDEKSVSRIDFTTKEILFTADMDFDIKAVIQATDGNRIYYMYKNSHEAEAGKHILRTATMDGRENQGLLQILLTLTIVLAVCAAIVLLFALLCLFKRGYSAKFMDVMRGFKKNWAIYAVILATMSLVAMFCFYPAIGSISLSFFDYTQESPARLWNGFAHYKYIFTTEGALSEFVNMFIFLASDIFTALLPPLVFAFFLTIMRNKTYSAITRTLLFIPGIIPGVATMLIWKTGIYGEYGVVNAIIKMFNGETVKFLAQSSTAKWSLILMGFPFVGSYLIFYGAMMNVPDSYYEAAELDGITVIKRFVFIDVPLIFAQIKYVLIMTFIGSVQNFGRTYMTTSGSWDTKTPVHTMYDNVVNGNYGRASAYATVLFIFLFIATMLNMRMQTKDNQVA